ncbi:hypothetical protein P7H17_16675 [Paenibacillus larvae]|nr:hypothetical protein [Paenibacillus larvae]MDT2287342.1 hypothetical protein [Paenibacillus larvae]
MQMLLAASGRQLPEEEYKRYIIAMQKAAGINEATKNNDLAAKEWMNYEPLPTNTCGRALFERS